MSIAIWQPWNDVVEGLVVVKPIEDVKGERGHWAEDVENVQGCQHNQELVEEVRSELPRGQDGNGGKGAQETSNAEGHVEDTFEPELDVHNER